MKTIITTVGVSLFENYQKSNAPLDDLESFEKAYSDDEWEYGRTTGEDICSKIIASDWIQNNPNASAEIKSLLKIKERLGELRTLLVTSDTLKGFLAGEILCRLLKEHYGIEAESPSRIKNFNVNQPAKDSGASIQAIKAGFEQYIHFLLHASNTYEESLAGYNIAGGFKAMIPISTLIASLKKRPLFYIYEQSDYLVEIPPFPFTYSLGICKTFEGLFRSLEKIEEIESKSDFYQELYSAASSEEQGILEYLVVNKKQGEKQFKTWSEIGRIIWEEYKESTKAIVFTEGKTDWKHLEKARKELHIDLNIRFKQAEDAVGDDWLLKKCKAFAEEAQTVPHIFIFDHDKPDYVELVMDGDLYKNWGNNVFSFAIPVPEHRKGYEKVSIEFYYSEAVLKTSTKDGRRLFLSSEFDPESRRHKEHADWRLARPADIAGELSEPKKSKLIAHGKRGDGVLDENNRQIALSKDNFVELIRGGEPPFHHVNFDAFREIFAEIEKILQTA